VAENLRLVGQEKPDGLIRGVTTQETGTRGMFQTKKLALNVLKKIGTVTFGGISAGVRSSGRLPVWKAARRPISQIHHGMNAIFHQEKAWVASFIKRRGIGHVTGGTEGVGYDY